MIEVEIKLAVTDSVAVRTKLLQIGFVENRKIEEHDIYFDNEKGYVRENGCALRVRETKNLYSKRVNAQINFKGKKLDSQTMTRQELETSVENADVCRRILEGIGYNPVIPKVVKIRQMLQKDKVTACLDQVQDLGEFLELEILVETEEEREDALGRIEDILKQLGYSIGDTLQTSYLSMLQKKIL